MVGAFGFGADGVFLNYSIAVSTILLLKPALSRRMSLPFVYTGRPP